MMHWRLTVNSSWDHLERSLHPRTWQERILRRISSVMKGLAQMFLLFDQDPGLRDCFKVSVRTWQWKAHMFNRKGYHLWMVDGGFSIAMLVYCSVCNLSAPLGLSFGMPHRFGWGDFWIHVHQASSKLPWPSEPVLMVSITISDHVASYQILEWWSKWNALRVWAKCISEYFPVNLQPSKSTPKIQYRYLVWRNISTYGIYLAASRPALG